MSSRDLDLVVIGDCNPDVLVLGADVTPAFGQQEKLVDRMSLEIGGSASITAVAAARLGLRVALVAAVGPDAAGTFMLDALAREGVDVSAVVVRDGMATGMTVALSRGGDRAILTALGAMDSLTAADIPAELLARARHVHVSSYFLLADSLGPGLAAVLSAARAAGRDHLARHQLGPGGAVARRAAVRRDRAGRPAAAQRGRGARAERCCYRRYGGASSLMALGPRVAVKLGARGVLVGVDSSALHQVSLPPVTPVDTTGAGDCFNAGLIAGLLQGLPLPRAAALGCATGALSTGALGGTAGAPGLEKAADLAAHATISAFALTRAVRTLESSRRIGCGNHAFRGVSVPQPDREA